MIHKQTMFRQKSLISVVTIILDVLLAGAFLFLGVATLLSPHVPTQAAIENILVGTVLIVTAAMLIYGLFRPISGGLFVCVCCVPIAFVFNAFRLSHALLPSREVGYHPFWSTITVIVLLVGMLLIVTGRRSQKVSE